MANKALKTSDNLVEPIPITKNILDKKKVNPIQK